MEGNLSIGSVSFSECSGLNSVTINSHNSSGTTIIAHDFEQATSLTSVTLSGNIIAIGRVVFGGCVSLVNVILPNSLKRLGVTEQEGGYGQAGDGVFQGCTSLTSITIPSGVTSIGDRAFSDCSGLTTVTVEATTPPQFVDGPSYYPADKHCFRNCVNLTSIYVPSESVAAYQSASGWNLHASIIRGIL